MAQWQVSDGQLTGAGAVPIAVGSGDWYAWLGADTTRAFAYRGATGSFSARRERQRHGLYWYAYRRRAGKLHKAYLGRAPALTPERLAAIAAALSNSAAPANRAHPAVGSLQPAATPAPLLATKLTAPRPR
ncbi:MAG: hypothetical protein H7Y32_18370, partial [Chloroflexales bacterium]|nr:hypothetical protein [Chloroflexales bacterium]